MLPPRWLAACLLALAACFVAPEVRADTIVVPAAMASTEGNVAASAPFEVPGRVQQVYSAAQFTGQGGNGPVLITGVRFRLNGNNGDVANVVVASIRFDVSTTAAAPGSLSSTFAFNVGADNTIVFGGATGGSGSPEVDYQSLGAAAGAVGEVVSVPNVASPTGIVNLDRGRVTQFVVSATPEPGTLLLFGLGAGGALGAARRRRRASLDPGAAPGSPLA